MPTVGCLTGWNGLNLMRKRKPAEARLEEIQIGNRSHHRLEAGGRHRSRLKPAKRTRIRNMS